MLYIILFHLENRVRATKNDCIVCNVVSYFVYNTSHRLPTSWSQSLVVQVEHGEWDIGSTDDDDNIQIIHFKNM